MVVLSSCHHLLVSHLPDSALLVAGTEDTQIQGSYALACARCLHSWAMHFVAMQAVAVKGRAAMCDNVECPKVDAKNIFCKCGGCSMTLYCSKKCQTLAWKQGGYKTMCKMKQSKHFEGKSQAISKSDTVFFHHLPICNVQHHLPLLWHLGCSPYPALRSCKLLIRVDYTAVLPAYSVVPLTEMQRREERCAHPCPPLKGPVDNVYSVVFLPMEGGAERPEEEAWVAEAEAADDGKR
ncbi:hypothetical protein B0H14DRAFT_3476647 [Mycena olivaceomarginata]|nr:hypothetical protein B0H14DRAFT_3476647 [Mycena olivaceomarginata]